MYMSSAQEADTHGQVHVHVYMYMYMYLHSSSHHPVSAKMATIRSLWQSQECRTTEGESAETPLL